MGAMHMSPAMGESSLHLSANSAPLFLQLGRLGVRLKFMCSLPCGYLHKARPAQERKKNLLPALPLKFKF